MRFTDNENEFEKLNTKFARDLDRLKDDYSRKAESLMYGDAAGLNMTKRRNRLWMWFDRATRYNIYAKIIVLAFIISLVLFLVGLMIDAFDSIYGGAAMILLFGIIFGTGMFVLNMVRPWQSEDDDWWLRWYTSVELPEQQRREQDRHDRESSSY